ncbi:hypothetical protein [Pseudohongiella spirulinae]|uniref:Uncharacterized protein n=1 Tax=Pseudohongiella spirulinae TaxID=1249552 RepID=A0A0S2KEE2_9GAMM|nr:hypothetical protein [Pseudohongiella spirulinae]ALO46601.1 hypothetical protein PS2015_1959 [Pseudohongiella spirulinae]
MINEVGEKPINMFRFCASEEHDSRSWLYAPGMICLDSAQDKWAMAASGGHIMIIAEGKDPHTNPYSSSADKFAEEKTALLLRPMRSIIDRGQDQSRWVDIWRLDLPAIAPCEICRGEGVLSGPCDLCHRHEDEDCHKCKATGMADQSVSLIDRDFNLEYIRLLQQELPHCRLYITPNNLSFGGCFIEFRGGFGCLMPLNRPYDIHHATFSMTAVAS